MSTVIQVKRSSVQGKVPTTTDLSLGEFAINSYDGKLYIKKNVNGTESIVDVTAGTNLTLTSNSSSVSVNSDTGTDATILAANSTVAGVLTADAQTIGGAKTFNSSVRVNNAALTLGPVGSEGGELQILNPDGTTVGWYLDIPSTNNALRIFSTANNSVLQIGQRGTGSTGGTIQFFTEDAEKARFSSTGNLGLGTNAPAAKIDIAGNAFLRNSTTATNLYVHNTYTDASNYERGVIGWTSNVLQIGTEAAGTGTRRAINLNYTTTIDGGSRTNVAALTITNVGAGTGGIALGVLNIGHTQDQTRITGFDVANKALGYGVRGSAVSGQGAHRFSGDNNTGTSVGATGSIVDILAPTTATNIFQCRQADGTVTLNVAYNGALTIANTVSQSTEATTLATVTKTQVASFPVASFRSGKLVVQAYNSVTGEVQISELLVAHNGTTASATEYGVVFTGALSFVTYDVDILSGNVRLMATNATANSTQYKISETLMVA
jgi:hypothetical protein